MNDTLTIGMVQMASQAEREGNLARLEDAFGRLSGQCDLAVFPENALCLGSDATVAAAARPLCDYFAELGGLCRAARLAAVFGGVPVADREAVTNTSLAFDADGSLLGRYDKMHLFQLNPGTPGGIDETLLYTPGPAPVSFELQGWTIGLSICYDLRFPELFRAYAGGDLVLCTAAFTKATGRAHWELLLRARAVENQCFVAGVGQCGINLETGTEHYGHSMVLDPWGERVACVAESAPTVLPVPLRRDRIAAVRAALPALRHRRPSLAVPPPPAES